MRIITLCILLSISFQGNAQFFTKMSNTPITSNAADSRSVNWVDVNNDGYIDCFISNGPQEGQNNALYINDQLGNFTYVFSDPIVADNKPSDGATFADLDNDGDLDAFVVNWYSFNNLAYLNDGTGKFEQITSGNIVTNGGFSETASFGDYNLDGLVDLYVTNSAGTNKNFLYKNKGDHEFEKIETGAPVTDATASRSVNWVDVDNDGDPDLFVTNESNQKDQLYKNENGAFEKITNIAITSENVSTMSSSWADIDNDGDQDLFLATDGSKNLLFRNDGNFVFTKILTTDISNHSTHSFSSAWSDIDNDGDVDLFVTNAFDFSTNQKLKNLLYLNDGTGHFTEVTQDATTTDLAWSYGCAFGDYDNDGFQDLAVATTRYAGTDEVDFLFRNKGNQNHWITLSLVGTVSNRSAIGAKVRIKSMINNQPVWQMREVSSQSAYCSQNDMRVHFGLADAETVDSIIIEWPSGIKQYYTNVPSKQFFMIQEWLANRVDDDILPITFNVYPNPVYGTIQLEAQFKTRVEELQLEIANDTGLTVYRALIAYPGVSWRYNLEISTLNLVPGIYYIKLLTDSQRVTKKIVIAK
jgi:hypothetical protein